MAGIPGFRPGPGRPGAPVTLVPPATVMNRAAVTAEVLSFVDLLPQIADTNSCITFLAEGGLSRNSLTRQACNVPCRRVARLGGIDLFEWRCPLCRQKKSLRDGSFFSGSHLSLRQLIIFIHLWCDDQPQTYIKQQTGIGTDDTVFDWCNFLGTFPHSIWHKTSLHWEASTPMANPPSWR